MGGEGTKADGRVAVGRAGNRLWGRKEGKGWLNVGERKRSASGAM